MKAGILNLFRVHLLFFGEKLEDISAKILELVMYIQYIVYPYGLTVGKLSQLLLVKLSVILPNYSSYEATRATIRTENTDKPKLTLLPQNMDISCFIVATTNATLQSRN
jgi:hypothetical protein